MEEQVDYRVPPPLRRHVRSITGYRIWGCEPGVHIGLPSAGITCVLDLAGGLVLSGLNLTGTQRFAASCTGLQLAPAKIHHDGTQHGIMLYLTATGIRDLFGIPAAEIVGRAVDLADLLGKDGRAILERVRDASGWRSLDVLSRLLLDRLPRDPCDSLAAQTWRQLAISGGDRRIGSLAKESGWSVRHLRSQFVTEFGMPPKAATRLMRFERSVDAVRRSRTLADAATACGYADQAHLTREWHRFAGLSPSGWLGRAEFTPLDDAAAASGDRLVRPGAPFPELHRK